MTRFFCKIDVSFYDYLLIDKVATKSNQISTLVKNVIIFMSTSGYTQRLNDTRRTDLAKTNIEADALEKLMSEEIERYFGVIIQSAANLGGHNW